MRIKEDSKRISCWVWGVALVGLLSPVLLAGCAGQDAIKGIEGGEAIGSSRSNAPSGEPYLIFQGAAIFFP